MARSTKPIPENCQRVIPSLTIRGAAEAMEFYKKALGAQEVMRMTAPDGRISHGELRIGDCLVFINDEFPEWGGCKSPQTLGGSTSSFYIYVEDVDNAFKRAVQAGGKESMPVTDMFWGDRYGTFVDPYGYTWGLSTHVEDVNQEELEKRAKAFHAQMAQQSQKKTA